MHKVYTLGLQVESFTALTIRFFRIVGVKNPDFHPCG
ncbi:Uncharacterised protein [Serratia grimesii]|nr:Uncharacterised protein [Serratia grimesii]CAI2458677.1 Uncharacterised protein [Serratia grimesii]CUW08283.1 Uncharacterised protein [Serratia grimesii]SMZ55796.1 Uncharacterised protein [Serratia grimesii]SUI32193.1 Uncharacterised protein [Serratia grimesii]